MFVAFFFLICFLSPFILKLNQSAECAASHYWGICHCPVITFTHSLKGNPLWPSFPSFLLVSAHSSALRLSKCTATVATCIIRSACGTITYLRAEQHHPWPHRLPCSTVLWLSCSVRLQTFTCSFWGLPPITYILGFVFLPLDELLYSFYNGFKHLLTFRGTYCLLWSLLMHQCAEFSLPLLLLRISLSP